MPASRISERACVATHTMSFIIRTTLALLAIAAAAGPQAAAAQTPCKAPSADCIAVGDLQVSLSFGYGTRTNPVKGRDDIPLFVIPYLSYYGKRFFLESLEPGVTLYESDAHTFNLIATPGFDRVFFSRNDPQNIVVPFAANVGAVGGNVVEEEKTFTVGHRHTTYLAGPEWLFRHREFIGQLSALYEFSGRHKGYEVRAAVSRPLIQSEQSLVVNAGLTWKSAATVDYFYGVQDLYRAGAALNPFVKLSYSLPLSERWTLTAFVHYEHLDDSIADSPIVEDREVVTAFAGFNFKVL
jgi:outer membrane protein